MIKFEIREGYMFPGTRETTIRWSWGFRGIASMVLDYGLEEKWRGPWKDYWWMRYE